MLTLHCPPGAVYALTRFLQSKGADGVTVAEIDYVFSPNNPLYAKLETALNGMPANRRFQPPLSGMAVMFTCGSFHNSTWCVK